MQLSSSLFVYSLAFFGFITASPDGNSGDSNHTEVNLKGRLLSDYLICPSGWTGGIGPDLMMYCFNCGLPNADFLGCNPGCTHGSCSAVSLLLLISKTSNVVHRTGQRAQGLI